MGFAEDMSARAPRFDDLNGEPLQFVDEFAPMQLAVVAVDGDSAEARQTNLRAHLHSESTRPL
ncbi:MAG: hypothetical protein R2911_31965 [Caldilineaceae bacterium]